MESSFVFAFIPFRNTRVKKVQLFCFQFSKSEIVLKPEAEEKCRDRYASEISFTSCGLWF